MIKNIRFTLNFRVNFYPKNVGCTMLSKKLVLLSSFVISSLAPTFLPALETPSLNEAISPILASFGTEPIKNGKSKKAVYDLADAAFITNLFNKIERGQLDPSNPEISQAAQEIVQRSAKTITKGLEKSDLDLTIKERLFVCRQLKLMFILLFKLGGLDQKTKQELLKAHKMLDLLSSPSFAARVFSLFYSNLGKVSAVAGTVFATLISFYAIKSVRNFAKASETLPDIAESLKETSENVAKMTEAGAKVSEEITKAENIGTFIDQIHQKRTQIAEIAQEFYQKLFPSSSATATQSKGFGEAFVGAFFKAIREDENTRKLVKDLVEIETDHIHGPVPGPRAPSEPPSADAIAAEREANKALYLALADKVLEAFTTNEAGKTLVKDLAKDAFVHFAPQRTADFAGTPHIPPTPLTAEQIAAEGKAKQDLYVAVLKELITTVVSDPGKGLIKDLAKEALDHHYAPRQSTNMGPNTDSKGSHPSSSSSTSSSSSSSSSRPELKRSSSSNSFFSRKGKEKSHPVETKNDEPVQPKGTAVQIFNTILKDLKAPDSALKPLLSDLKPILIGKKLSMPTEPSSASSSSSSSSSASSTTTQDDEAGLIPFALALTFKHMFPSKPEPKPVLTPGNSSSSSSSSSASGSLPPAVAQQENPDPTLKYLIDQLKPELGDISAQNLINTMGNNVPALTAILEKIPAILYANNGFAPSTSSP